MRRLRVWLRALLQRNALEREMSDEMQEHLDRATERLVARGMTAAHARDAARREFGNVESIKEAARDARGARWLQDAWKDVRYGVRSLARTPTFTVVAVLSLTLGIGLNTALFTIIKRSLRPAVVVEPATLVNLANNRSYATFSALRERSRSLSSTFARSQESVLLARATPGAEPVRASAELVSEDFFAALRVRPHIGRIFAADENAFARGAPVAVLSHRFWRSRFAADSAVLGRIVRLVNNVSFTVIGVMPQTFAGADRHTPDFWIPLATRSLLPAVYQVTPRGDWFSDPEAAWLRVHGRLTQGSSLNAARSELALLLRQIEGDSTIDARAGTMITTADASGLNSNSEKLGALLVLLATLAVLLIACANVANLMLARAAARQREITVRLCLGASRGRLVRQLLAESLVLATLGGAAAMLIVTWALHTTIAAGALAPLASGDPELVVRQLSPDRWVLGYMLLLASLSAIAFGLAPALHATRPDLAGAVKGDSTSFGERLTRSRLRHGLVIGQVALSLTLLVSAAVLVRSVARALALDPGFDRERVLMVSTSWAMQAYDSARLARFDEALAPRLASIPGIAGVARGTIPLIERARASLSPSSAVPNASAVGGFMAGVTPSYFDVMGIPIVRGRSFRDEEVRLRMSVTVVSARTAQTLWPGEDPLGKSVSVTPNWKASDLGTFPQATVIGIARDAEMADLGRVPSAFAYVPSTGGTLIVRVHDDMPYPSAAIRQLAASIDSQVPVSVQSLAAAIAADGDFAGAKLAAAFASAVGVLALLLATVGIFGVVSYAVAQRTRELGIRAALGARPTAVIGLVLRSGLRLVAIGATIGVLAGVGATRLMAALLFGMNPIDPIAFAAIALILLAVALLGCYVPARRAARADPLVALRYE